MTEPSVIEVRDATRAFCSGPDARRAVDRASFEVRSGEVVLVVGPSGSGKSTLLAMLGGLDRGYTGSVRVFDHDLAALDDRALSRLRGERIGFVFQAFHLLPELTVLENVTAPNLFAARPSAPDTIDARARVALARVGLAERADARPGELSGGQRQRVAIARALIREPALLLCDEPTGNLDRATGEQIIDLFGELHRELGTTLVIVTHEERLERIADRSFLMTDGVLGSGSGSS